MSHSLVKRVVYGALVCQDKCYVLHYPMLNCWIQPTFDDSPQPRAFEYTDQDVGIMGLPGYYHSPEAFAGSSQIWIRTLIFDNTILLRKTVK